MKDSTITGDIGNFGKGPDATGDSQFGIALNQMGGLFAGAGGAGAVAGTAGGIENVTAKRIAAILAVNANTTADTLTTANAVASIAGVVASQVGADTDEDTLFDFTNVGGTADFDLGVNDIAFDGLVIVKAPLAAGAITGTVLKTVLV